jgi:hypothetical protein
MFPPVYYELAQSKGHDLERRFGQATNPKQPVGSRIQGSEDDHVASCDVPSDPEKAPLLAEIRQFPTRSRASESACGQEATVASVGRRPGWERRHRPA